MNYYNFLEIEPTENIEDIKKAYRETAKKYHPDVNKNGLDKFLKAKEAYACLSVPHLKANYDRANRISFVKSQPVQPKNKKYEDMSRAELLKEYRKLKSELEVCEKIYSTNKNKEYKTKIDRLKSDIVKIHNTASKSVIRSYDPPINQETNTIKLSYM